MHSDDDRQRAIERALSGRPLETKHVAAILDWSVQRARRWLKATGSATKRLGVMGRPGGRYLTTLGRLMASFPEVARAALDRRRRDESHED